MIVEGVSENQNTLGDTSGYKGYFLTTHVSEVDLYTGKRSTEQRSELQVNKGLIVHVLSSSYNVSSFDL